MLLVAGVVGAQPALALVALGLLLWLIGEGLLFSFRVRWAVRDLALGREVRDERGPVASLWAGRTFQVRLTLSLRGRWRLPHVTFEEPVPFGLEQAGGSPRGEGWIGPDDDLLTAY